jgi:quercetin dioxygenase-like cupin family protein
MQQGEGGLISVPMFFQMVRDGREFRRVVMTEPEIQVVIMSLKPKQVLKPEVHSGAQMFVVLEGGITVIDVGRKAEKHVGEGGIVLIRTGTNHSVIADDGVKETKVFTTYTPPQHAASTIHMTDPE